MERTVDTFPNSAHMYMRTLEALSNETKLELISLLSLSMTHNSDVERKEKKDIDLYSCFKGNWGESMNTREYCERLRHDGVNVSDSKL